LVRLGTHSPSTSRYDEQGVYQPLDYYNWLNLDASVVGWIIKGALLAFAVLIVWSCRTPTTPRHGWRLAAEDSLILLGMLLLSERTWKHHCVTLFLPFAVLTYVLATCSLRLGMRVYLTGTLIAAISLMTSTSIGFYDGWVDKMAQVYGAYVWAFLL